MTDPVLLGSLIVNVALAACLVAALRPPRRPRQHRHEGASWDGWFERCRCGVSAGDRKGPDGLCLALFSEWPDEARTVQR